MSSAAGVLRGLLRRASALERLSRPRDPESVAALRRRWDALPDVVRTPAQLLGRHTVGCEGTHGVFPKCNLACTPCYHSRDANQVRVDGPHTLAEVERQMQLLREQRGPFAHAQLIGGEVSLLDPDTHAAALATMRRYGREPMSFTHGDVDEDYVRRLVLGSDGRPRIGRVSFAAHFDRFMYGRRDIPRPPSEAALHPYRQRFADIFVWLRREHGVRYFLAHNMTVTPGNLDEVADVVRAGLAMPYGMFSFQPAAFLGDQRRWREQYRAATPDAVWAEIERGVGTPLDPTVLQYGDLRCNRVAHGVVVRGRWYPLLEAAEPRDLAARDAFLRHLGATDFTEAPPGVVALRVVRVLIRHPASLLVGVDWLRRLLRRAGGTVAVLRAAARREVRSVSFVMHQFMDAAEVEPAWELMRRGETATDPAVRGTQERLAACHYTMAHPEDGTLVPACVQHAVLDPGENAALRTLLPLVERRSGPSRSGSGAARVRVPGAPCRTERPDG